MALLGSVAPANLSVSLPLANPNRLNTSKGVLSGKVIQSIDCGTHTLFIADVTEAKVLSQEPSVTYAYYFAHIKPKPLPAAMSEVKKGWICKICGFIYEGESLPDDYICPICKHGAEDFEPLD